MKKILVPIDGSPNSVRGLEKAIEFAKNDNSSITLLHIATLPPVHVIGHSKDKVKKSLAKNAQKFIKDAEDRCINQSIHFTTKLVYGSDPPYDIEQFAKKYKHDLIVIGAKGKSTLKRLFLGSVSSYLVETTKTPVTVIK
ncbi:universal stress protein [Candidatus Nitrosarchaeum limnium]|uniref:Universal stress family protein n=1 Tax=Candidatus Nitrosarchaeum limnium BG20 TaxID=859192 RepID=S2EA13_9ARCH|nr:universal stress protein [Candidatus Nitrosarchaeum limnium]EPA06251.1 universal stress family protein [Candidatus Nitrosarchaeum limnium BG20]